MTDAGCLLRHPPLTQAVSGTIRFEDRDLIGLPLHKFADLGIARKFQVPSLFSLRGRRPTPAGVLLVADAIAHNRVAVGGAAGVYVVVLWDADKLLKQLALGEDSRVEFKEVVFRDGRVREPRRERIANELAAFGNTLGGALIFSVSDAGEVRPMTRENMDALEAYVSEICADSIDPPLAFTTQRLALPDGSSALVVDVERSPLVHRSPGGYLSRQGSSARELSPEALRRLFQQRGRSGLLGPDEEIVTGTGLNTLESALVDRFISSRTRQATRRSSPSWGWCAKTTTAFPAQPLPEYCSARSAPAHTSTVP